MVFLAFMALKVKRKVLPKFWMPVDYDWKIQKKLYLAFPLTLKKIAFFFWIYLVPMKSNGMQEFYI